MVAGLGFRLARLVVPSVLLVVTGACAGKAKWDETREVYVVSVPGGAVVDLEGRPAGSTPVSIALPAAGRHPGQLEVRLERIGFRAEARRFSSATPPDRLVVVMLPELADAPSIAPATDDAEGFYRLGRLLMDHRRCRDAIEYFDRALVLAPRHALAHRDRGGCMLDLGEAELAADNLSRYLLLVPDAPDATNIQTQLEAIRGPKPNDLNVAGDEE